jgi:hypothetical protein
MGQTRVLSTNQAERLETLERGENQQQAKHREREKKKENIGWTLFFFFFPLFFSSPPYGVLTQIQILNGCGMPVEPGFRFQTW